MSKPRLIFGGLVAFYLMGIVVVAAVWAARPAAAALGQVPPVSLSPNLTIGVDDGDEKLMFGYIVRVDVDGRGNIYILDYKFRRVSVFDSKGNLLRQIAVPEGQGPQEATDLAGLAVTPSGTMFINDMQKVIVYGPVGKSGRLTSQGRLWSLTSRACSTLPNRKGALPGLCLEQRVSQKSFAAPL
jgi:hypothetical protein